MVKKINKLNFDQRINSEKTVIVDFYADWCGPCRMLAPILDELALENPDLEVYKLDVDDDQEIASKYGVVNIPTLISFKKGEEMGRIRGAVPKEIILEELAG